MINTPDALYYQQYNATSNIKGINSQQNMLSSDIKKRHM
jgi:hypothetical protein